MINLQTSDADAPPKDIPAKANRLTFFVEQLNTKSDEVTRFGVSDTLEGAIALAKEIVDEYLRHQVRYEASADALYTRYQESGIIPCIFRDDGETLDIRNFDHYQYASLQSVKMMALAKQASPDSRAAIGECKTLDTGRFRQP